MNTILLPSGFGDAMRRSTSLASFKDYRQAEAQNPQQLSVTLEGTLLEYETLELRIHPPNVQIDNETYDDMTVITIDSANRPGTLIEVVQCLTELGLSIRRSRISSDGGWFVDGEPGQDQEFFVSETPKGKLLDARKLVTIKKVLHVEVDNTVSAYKDVKESCTVFELSGQDRHGLLASVLQVLAGYGCEVLTAAVWTFHNRVALVVAVTEAGSPIADQDKLSMLGTTLYEMLGAGDAVVANEMVNGAIHHERRLHHLLLLEELNSWEVQVGSQTHSQTQSQCVTPTAAAAATLRRLTGSGSSSAIAQPPLAQSNPAPSSAQPSAANPAYFFTAEGTGSESATGESSSGAPVLQRNPSLAGASSATSIRTGAQTTAGLPASHQPADSSGSSSSTSSPTDQASSSTTITTEASEVCNGRANGSSSGGGSGSDPTDLSPLPLPSLSLHTSPFETSDITLPAIDEVHPSCPPHTATSLRPLSLSQVSIDPGMSAFLSQAAGYLGATTSQSVAHIAPALTSTQSPETPGRGIASGQQDSVRSIAKAEVKIQHSSLLNYWLVTITSRDRNKLFFDTVCTLADMHYDIFHATIDSEGELASQLFYVRPRYGECVWDPSKANKLKYMLESSVQRRFPRGLKVLVTSIGRVGNLANLFLVLSSAGLWVTRAEVCAQQDGASYQVTLTDASGNLPDARAVQRTCESAGGILGVYDDPHGNSNSSGGHSSGGMATRLALGSGTGRHSNLPTTATSGGSGAPKVPATFRFSFVDKSYSATGNAWAPPASSPPTPHSHGTPMHFPLRP